MYNLSNTATITVTLSTIPVPDETMSGKGVGFIELDSLVEVDLLLFPELFRVCTIEPGFISFTNSSWNEEMQIIMTTVDDLQFTAFEEVIEIEFRTKSVDPRFHNLTMDKLHIHIWDDDHIDTPFEIPEPYRWYLDPTIMPALIAVVLAAIGFTFWRWRKKRKERKEWKLHHELLCVLQSLDFKRLLIHIFAVDF